MKKIVFILVFLFTVPVISASVEDNFIRGIVYLLEKDAALARKNLQKYFMQKPNPQVRNGFMLLLENKDWEAAKKFKGYLDINHRSAHALVGISLATRDIKNSSSVENLRRVMRLRPDFTAAHLCLGRANHEAGKISEARSNYIAALKTSSLAEVRIPAAGYFLDTGDPGRALSLVENPARRFPDNYYFNYLAAGAKIQMGRISEGEMYLDAAMEINPAGIDVQILKARFLFEQNRAKEARTLLDRIKVGEDNAAFLKLKSRVLLSLKDKRCLRSMYLLFKNSPWDREVNELMAEYFKNVLQAKEYAHWVRRSMLSGADGTELKKKLGLEKVPDRIKGVPFFSVRRLKWLNDSVLLAVARRKSSQNEALYVIDTVRAEVASQIRINGRLMDFHQGNTKDSFVYSVAVTGEDKINLFLVNLRGKSALAQRINPVPLPLSGAVTGWNKNRNLLYITDARCSQLARESPFSIISELGQKTPVFPEIAFPVYVYNVFSRRMRRIKDPGTIERIPVGPWKDYMLIREAFAACAKVSRLIEMGRTYDLASSETVKIVVSVDRSAILIYKTDLQKAFQALVYEFATQKIHTFDESMFLPAGRYSTVEVRYFSSRNRRIILLTNDRERDLIMFDYGSRLYQVLGHRVMDLVIVPDASVLYVLRERNRRGARIDTYWDTISISPFLKKTRPGFFRFSRLLYPDSLGQLFGETYNGERMKLDILGNMKYMGPALKGAVSAENKARTRAAVFVNRRVVVIEWEKDG